jgi:hypothetical protein
MNEFKSYASRELNQSTSERPDRKRWARHGSTRWLWKDEDVCRSSPLLCRTPVSPAPLPECSPLGLFPLAVLLQLLQLAVRLLEHPRQPAVYSGIPPYGLGKAGRLVPASGRKETARGRAGKD